MHHPRKLDVYKRQVLDRVVDTIKDVAADVQEVFSSDDGDVPLANQNLDEHKC